MKALNFVSGIVAILLLACIISTALWSFVNCVAPMSKEAQAEKLEPMLEMYRGFGLNATTIQLHNDEQEREAVAYYSARSRGQEVGQ